MNQFQFVYLYFLFLKKKNKTARALHMQIIVNNNLVFAKRLKENKRKKKMYGEKTGNNEGVDARSFYSNCSFRECCLFFAFLLSAKSRKP